MAAIRHPLPGVDLSSALRAARTAALGKRRSPGVAAFLLDAEGHSAELCAALASGRFRPSAPRGFWIREPKPRLISALPFRDRVVQHLLVGATLPALERWFAPQSYACRGGTGRTAASAARQS